MISALHRISELESIVSGFATTDTSRWGRAKIIETMNSGRAVAISNSLQGATRLHPSWQQKIVIPYLSYEKESNCYSTFDFPYSVIKATKTHDGCTFVGNKDFNVAYDRINSRGELLNMQKHPILNRAITHRIAALFEEGKWYIYTEKNIAIRSLGVIAIFNHPTELPHYNLEKDEYPVDDTTWDFIRGYLKEKLLNQVEATPIQTPTTNKDLSEFRVPTRRR